MPEFHHICLLPIEILSILKLSFASSVLVHERKKSNSPVSCCDHNHTHFTLNYTSTKICCYQLKEDLTCTCNYLSLRILDYLVSLSLYCFQQNYLTHKRVQYVFQKGHCNASIRLSQTFKQPKNHNTENKKKSWKLRT